MERDASSLRAAIAHAEAGFTRLEARISAYLLARPEAILVETSAETARKLGVSPMTVTRFYRKLGFDGVAEVRAKERSKAFGPGSSRMDLRFDSNNELPRDHDEDRAFAHAALDAAFAMRETPEWHTIVDMVTHSDSVHVVGFQTMHFFADGLSRRLAYVRNRVQLHDGIDGVYAGLLPEPGERATLIIIDTFRYGAHGPLLAQLARERGADVVIFADEFCDWAAGLTPHVLRYPAETRFVLALPQGITMGLTLLLQDVTAKLGEAARARIEKLSDAQDHFGLFLD